VNFDVPHVPDDYIHRVGRTARAERTGDAFTFVSPEEESDLRAIEKALGRRLPRITVPGFDYSAAPAERLEVPLAERIAAIRARKAGDRERAKAKAERRGSAAAPAPRRLGGPVASRPPARPSGSSGAPTSWSSRRSRRRPGVRSSARSPRP
jgi:ATP-dependent RNA helicase RhlE